MFEVIIESIDNPHQRLQLIEWLESRNLRSYIESLEERDIGEVFDTPQASLFDERAHRAAICLYVGERELASRLALELRQEFPAVTVRIQQLPDVDWVEESKAHFPPIHAGRWFVYPPWHKSLPPQKIGLCVEPGMAFGNGQHETTRLSLMAIDAHEGCPKRVLDVGTGSGILAVAAKQRWGEALVVGCDIDGESVRAARQTAVRNSVQIELHEGSLESVALIPAYDLVLANIHLSVHLILFPLLVQSVERQGTLIVSGILVEQEAILRECAELHGLIVHEDLSLRESGWSALVLTRPH